MAAESGLLLLTRPLKRIRGRIPSILDFIKSKFPRVLYVQIHPNLDEAFSQKNKASFLTIPPSKGYTQLVSEFYVEAAKRHELPDVRVLLRNIGAKSPFPKVSLAHSIKEVYTDSLLTENDILIYLNEWMRTSHPANFSPRLEFIKDDVWKDSSGNDSMQEGESDVDTRRKSIEILPTYPHVVIGGTFDRLHAGHKVLLLEAAIRADQKLTVGVTDQAMNKKKTLPELILPVKQRINDVYNFLYDIRHWTAHRDLIVPISDPFGPSIVAPDMGLIVVSEETKKGGEAVNVKRKEKGLNELDIHVIDLLEDTNRSTHEETKISSSSQRIRLLGTLLHEPKPKPDLSSTPFIIGLTGGIASGKSSVCKRLEKLGAGVVDCDKLGHKAYLPDTAAYRQIIEHFGTDIIGDDKHINRRALGAKVFSDKSQLQVLNGIVWPAIAKMANEQIAEMEKNGKTVCILDAAVLLQANWDNITHEVWSCIIPREEALKRIQDRDNLPEERAIQRIDSQLSNDEIVNRSNVVFCTFWEYEFTQQQVEKAWSDLQHRISVESSPSANL